MQDSRHSIRRSLPAILILAGALLVSTPGARAANPTAGTEAELVAAIQAVNASGPGSHTITLAADITLTGLLPALDNPAAGELLIDGADFALTGDNAHTILSVAPGTAVRLRDLTISNGSGSGGPDGKSGGGIDNRGRLTINNTTLSGNRATHGGGILNGGSLTVESSLISDNAAVHGGGGIYNTGALTINASTLSGNSAAAGGGIATLAQTVNAGVTIAGSSLAFNTAGMGGGIYVYADNGGAAAVTLRNVLHEANTATAGAGAIDLFANAAGGVTATVTGSRFVDNHGARGGALGALARNGQLAVNVSNTTLGGNVADEGGAVAATAESAGTARVTLAGSTVWNNLATLAGGGVYTVATSQGITSLTVFNATLSGNMAGAGGGLHLSGSGGTVGATITYSTLAGNTAGLGGGGIHTAAAGGAATATLTATIISSPGSRPACVRAGGNIVSTGYNLSSDASCSLTQGNDQPATAAGLLPLALNVPGATATHALDVTSPGRNRVPIGAAGCGTAVTRDQRGAPRPQPDGGRCDVGAYERTEVVYSSYLPLGIR